MICTNQKLYLQTLLQLQVGGVQFCVIGTFGLGLHHSHFPLYPVKDCDLVVKNDSANLNKFARILTDHHWQIYSWNEAVTYPLSLEKLVDRYYLRAVQQQAILDVTYECAFISWSEFYQQICFIKGIPIASIFHILHLKKIRNTTKDREVVERVLALLKHG